ncbi:hypothetical protein ABZ353_33255 [Streptomyces niveus]|uniref:hypothetical protein n=1 Tax=Streptomyces niveus TaxID=193462 RepID=UPI0033ECFC4E
MDLVAAEIEGLFEELGLRGVTLVIQVDHSLLATGESPWSILISGPAVRHGGIQIESCRTFSECLESGLRKLREISDEWEWLEMYL